MPRSTGLDAEQVTYAQWDYLYNMITSEVNVGNNGLPGTGTNPTGRLQTVASVAQSTWPDFSALPFIGVQLDNVVEEYYASNRTHKLTCEFSIIAVVEIDSADANLIKVSDAMVALRAIIRSSSGQGLGPILRNKSPQVLTLGSNADEFTPTLWTYTWDKSPVGKGTSYIAYATVKLKSTVRLNVSG